MTPGPLALAGAAAVALLLRVLTVPVLRRLAEPPPDDPDASDKVPYAVLAVPRVATAVALLGSAAALAGLVAVPLRAQPLWLVLATAGVLCAVVDAVTTWLPNRLVYPGWLLMALAALGCLGTGSSGGDLLRGLVGGVVGGCLYLVVFHVSRGGFGFADVRFAPLVGTAAAGVSWSLLVSALVLGTVVGGLVGVARLLLHRRGEFAYVPSMLAGAYVAAVLSYLTSTA